MKTNSIKVLTASILFGAGIGFGFLPILLASIILRRNLFKITFSVMSKRFWSVYGTKFEKYER